MVNTSVRRIFFGCVPFAFFLLLVGCRATVAADQKGTEEIVANVVDGDTIRIRRPGRRSELVRLIGLDAPEKRLNARAEGSARRNHVDVRKILFLGEKASNYLRDRLPKGSVIMLEYDVEHRDRYGRLLAYVYLPDKTCLNKAILAAGYAHLLTVPPNIRHSEMFRAAYREAREAGAGLWAYPEFGATGFGEKRRNASE